MQDCAEVIKFLHRAPKQYGCIRSLLFMVAKFGSLIHLGGVAVLVLKAQMGGESFNYLFTLHHWKYVPVKGVITSQWPSHICASLMFSYCQKCSLMARFHLKRRSWNCFQWAECINYYQMSSLRTVEWINLIVWGKIQHSANWSAFNINTNCWLKSPHAHRFSFYIETIV